MSTSESLNEPSKIWSSCSLELWHGIDSDDKLVKCLHPQPIKPARKLLHATYSNVSYNTDYIYPADGDEWFPISIFLALLILLKVVKLIETFLKKSHKFDEIQQN